MRRQSVTRGQMDGDKYRGSPRPDQRNLGDKCSQTPNLPNKCLETNGDAGAVNGLGRKRKMMRPVSQAYS